MKQLVCEICHKTDFKKENGEFVCQSCGCRYPLEEAQKLLAWSDETPSVPENSADPSSRPVPVSDTIFERIKLFTEDGNREKALEYCERALDSDPHNGLVYLYRLTASLNLKKPENLKNMTGSLTAFDDYQKALRYADDDLKKELIGYENDIAARNEVNRKNAVYNEAAALMQSGEEDKIFRGAELMKSISGWSNADEWLGTADQRIEAARAAATVRRDEENREKTKKKKKTKKILAITLPCVALLITLSLLFVFLAIPAIKKSAAVKLYKEGRMEEAKAAFYKIKDYSDCKEYYDSIIAQPQTIITTDADGETTEEYYDISVHENGVLKKYVEYEEDYVSYEASYNDRGNPLKTVYRFSDGSENTYEYEYDSRNNLIKETRSTSSGDSTTEYSYDSRDNLILSVREDSGGDTSRTEYSYDSRDNLISEVQEYSGGDTYRTVYTYDSRDNMLTKVYTNPSGGFSTTDYSYDSHDNMIKEIYTYPDGDTTTTEYVYDGHDNKIKEIRTDYDGSESIGEYTYDGRDNCIFYKHTSSSEDENDSWYTIEYTYDGHDNPIKMIYKNSDYDEGEFETYELTYNDRGVPLSGAYTDVSSNVETYEYSDFVYYVEEPYEGK